ncbi:MAG: hypothetical protein CME60_06165 [Halobacteriovoraceae bacterium]|nr:hypothetical protein [Halobacteriovoraceae bacterium]|tara:strand:+ start:132 stop:962 length:831 start_codon:yes stop_codon:yes gene_type:complete
MNHLNSLSFLLTMWLLCVNSSQAAESFFAKDMIRNLFDIKVSEKRVISKEKKEKSVPFQTHDQNGLQILVWNIYKGDLFNKLPLPLKYEDYEFILIQEFSENINDSFLPHAHSYFLPTFTWEEKKTGVALFSKWPLEIVKPIHTYYREPFILTPKSTLIAKFKDILLVNTHALNFVSQEEWEFELKNVAKEIRGHSKIIWGGDFNTWNSSRIQFLKVLMDQLGLEEVIFKKDKRTTHLGYPIDFIFVKGMKIESSQSLESQDFSDHNPISVELKLN